jgi:uncharacterized Fe-S cluster-containing radical SAM superfamily protein
MLDPILLSEKIEKVVTKDGLKKYYRFRPARFYGGILSCTFCWVNRPRKRPREWGEFYSAKEVATKLDAIAKVKRHFFILETNGILLGGDEGYVKELAKKEVYVRVALKGATNEEFSLLTMVEPKFFDYQLRALAYLKKYNMKFHPAVMTFSEGIEELKERLRSIDEGLPRQLEIEELILFPHVRKGLEKAGIYEKIS